MNELSALVALVTDTPPLALVAALALFGLAYQTRRLTVLQEQLYQLSVSVMSREKVPNVGILARALGHVSESDLRRAVVAQRDVRPNDRLGAILVDFGALPRWKLWKVLDTQTDMRLGRTPPVDVTHKLASYALTIQRGKGR